MKIKAYMCSFELRELIGGKMAIHKIESINKNSKIYARPKIKPDIVGDIDTISKYLSSLGGSNSAAYFKEQIKELLDAK